MAADFSSPEDPNQDPTRDDQSVDVAVADVDPILDPFAVDVIEDSDDEHRSLDGNADEEATQAASNIEEHIVHRGEAGKTSSTDTLATGSFVEETQQGQHDEESNCCLCLEPFLDHPVCALSCGHVYHSHCFQTQLSKTGKGECSLCRKVCPEHQIRCLSFRAADAGPPQSLEQIQKLEASSIEDLQRLVEESEQSEEKAHAEIRELDTEVAAYRCQTEELRETKKSVLSRGVKQAQEISELQYVRNREATECQKMDTTWQAMRERQLARLPIPQQIVEDDVTREERRHLRTKPPAKRAEQLHEALLSSRLLVDEACRLVKDRSAAADEAEAELKRLRKVESRLKRELSEAREEADLHRGDAPAPLSGSSKAASTVARETAQLRRTLSTATADEKKPSKLRKGPESVHGDGVGAMNSRTRAPNLDDSDDLLYSGLPSSGRGQTRLAGGFLGVSRAAPSVIQRAPTPVAATTVTSSRRTGLNALFTRSGQG